MVVCVGWFAFVFLWDTVNDVLLLALALCCLLILIRLIVLVVFILCFNWCVNLCSWLLNTCVFVFVLFCYLWHVLMLFCVVVLICVVGLCL